MPDKTTENYNEQQKQAQLEEYFQKGNDYYFGDGVEQDYAEAVKWYQKAAEQGYADAQYSLGYCYENGQGVLKSTAEAVKWYTKASEQGYEDAKKALRKLNGFMGLFKRL